MDVVKRQFKTGGRGEGYWERTDEQASTDEGKSLFLGAVGAVATSSEFELEVGQRSEESLK